MLVVYLWVESSFEFLLRHVWDVWDTLYTGCPKKVIIQKNHTQN